MILQVLSFHRKLRDGKTAKVVIVHIFQMAIPWRYTRLLFSNRIPITNNEIWDSFLLRAIHTFFCSLPILYLQGYKILISLDSFNINESWYLIASCSTSLVSIAWSLATYQRYRDYCCVLGFTPPWGATFMKLLWRMCEVTSRLLSLCLFSLVHTFWVFLVIGFHWVTMLLVLILDRVLQSNEEEQKIRDYLQLILNSYMYIFSHLNLTSKKSKYGFIFFYVICCLESVALLTLWIMYDKRTQYHIPFAVTVAGGYAVALIFGLLYYNCFHRPSSSYEQKEMVNKVCLHECADCRLQEYNNKRISTSKPWLQVAPNPDPQFLDILQSPNSNVEPATGLDVSNSLPNHEITQLDARMLQRTRFVDGQATSSKKGVYNGIMEWEDYDLQIRETPEGASIQDSQPKESPRSSINSKGCHSRHTSADESKDASMDSPNKVVDQGYFSGISASSKDTKKKTMLLRTEYTKQMLPHKLSNQTDEQLKFSNSRESAHKTHQKHKNHHQRQQSNGILSDATTGSSFSTTSSKRPILNCERCGHCVSIDSTSLYSVTSTSAASVGSSTHGSRQTSNSLDRTLVVKQHQLNDANKKCPHHSQSHLSKHVPQRSLYNLINTRLMSDATSSGWECTDSEV